MINHVVKHELRVLLRERALLVMVPLYVLLIAYGLWSGSSWRDFLVRNTAAATAMANANVERWAGQYRLLDQGLTLSISEDPRSPGRMARLNGYEFATKPPTESMVMAIGQSDLYPSYRKVQWAPMYAQSNADEAVNPTALGIGRFDLAFVILYLYPLLIIALSFNLLSGERDGGTQALLFSQPVRLSQLVLGKVIIRGVIVIGAALLLGAAGLAIVSPELLVGAGLLRLLLWMLLVLVYGAFWFGLAILVNAFGARSSTNALALMGCWLTLVLLIPGALNLATKSLYPLPSRIELVQAARRGQDEAAEESRRAASSKIEAELVSRLGEQSEVDTLRDYYKRLQPVERRAERIARPIFDTFERRRRSQIALSETLRFVSPAILFQTAIADLAETGSRSYTRFADQIEDYHARYRAYYGSRTDAGELMTEDEMRRFPRFHYVNDDDGSVIGRALANLMVLIVMAGAMLGIGFLRLRDYPIGQR